MVRQSGSSWHPELQPFGVMNCINCTCLSTGEVTCHSKPQCPPVTCRSPVTREGECCPTCEHDTGHSRENKRYKIRHKQCRHGGAPYQHGQVFPSTKTALKATRANQCVLCICLDGDVMCHLKTCQNLTCSKPVYVDDDCCPICEDPAKEGHTWPDYRDTYDFLNGGESSPSGPDCVTVDGVHANGTSWTPVVGPFGRMNCVTCTCKNGGIECDKIECSKGRSASCRKSQADAGQCCPCRSRNNKKPRRRYRPKGKRKQKTSKDDKTKQSQEEAVINTPCLPKQMDTITRVADLARSLSILFENVKTGKIERLTWTVDKGRVKQVKIESIPTSTFTQWLSTHSATYRIIGATKQKRIKKFKSRLQRMEQRCRDRCRKAAVLKLRNHLKLRKISFKTNCK